VTQKKKNIGLIYTKKWIEREQLIHTRLNGMGSQTGRYGSKVHSEG
jgi:hypothetical protein